MKHLKKLKNKQNKVLNLSNPEERICARCRSDIEIIENFYFTKIKCKNKSCNFEHIF